MQYLIVLALFASAQAAPQYFGAQAIPTVKADGHLADTPAVAAAKVEHFEAHARALGADVAPVVSYAPVYSTPARVLAPQAPIVAAAPAATYIQSPEVRIAPAYTPAYAPAYAPAYSSAYAPAYSRVAYSPSYVAPAYSYNRYLF